MISRQIHLVLIQHYYFRFFTMSNKPCFSHKKRSTPLSFINGDISQRLQSISLLFTVCALNEATMNECTFCFFLFTPRLVVVSSYHQSPILCVSLLRTAPYITILLLVWSASKGSRKGGGCHEANDRSCGNGCAFVGSILFMN